jgi:hypothetical protein
MSVAGGNSRSICEVLTEAEAVQRSQGDRWIEKATTRPLTSPRMFESRARDADNIVGRPFVDVSV